MTEGSGSGDGRKGSSVARGNSGDVLGAAMNKDITVLLERALARAAPTPLLILTIEFPRYLCDRAASFHTASENVTCQTLLQALGQTSSDAQ